MSMTYAQLQENVRQWLYNRKDLQAQIPVFIEIAERKIFRRLRVANMEKVTTFQSNEDTTIEHLTLPKDLLEIKLLLIDGRPATPQTDQWIYNRLAVSPLVGFPQYFARDAQMLVFYPSPDDNYPVRMTYYSDLSGQLVEDDDTNDILRIAPDLYIYGALIEAEPYLENDQRVATWKQKFEEGIAELNWQTDEAELAGGTVEISSVAADSSDIGYSSSERI